MQKLSQRDSRWQNILLGTSQKTIGSHGCVITCLAMLAGTTPDVVNEKLKNAGGYAQTNLIIWTKIKEAFPNLEFEWRGYGYDNDRVKKAIEDHGGCLVEVSGARIGGGKHWVLFIGDGKMIDPWTGVEKSTSWYGNPTGYAIIKKSGESIGQTDLEACLKSHKDLLDQLTEEKKLHEETRTELRESRDQNKTLNDQINDYADILKCESKHDVIKAKMNTLISVEDELNVVKKNMEKKEAEFTRREDQLKAEIDSLSEKFNQQEKKYELVIMEMRNENEKLQKRLEEIKIDIDKEEEKKDQHNWFESLLKKLLDIKEKK